MDCPQIREVYFCAMVTRHRGLKCEPRQTPPVAILTLILAACCAPAVAQTTHAPLSSPAPSTATVAQISVLVDGQAVEFTGAPPQEIHNAVMVPLRGVLNKMGATVAYDEPTKTVHVQEGAMSIALPIGSTTASVNGKPVTLAQPAIAVAGTALVPLRFVSEALGAYVAWDASTETVRIITPSAHLSTLPAPPAALGTTFIGQLTGVYPNTNPEQITVRVGAGEETVLAVSPIATQIVLNYGQPAAGLAQVHAVALSALQPGDQVRITRAKDGQAVNIAAIFGEVMGVIAKITPNPDGSHTILLNDGITVQLLPNAQVSMAGRRVGISEVMAAERVVIGTDPDNKTGYGMAVVTPNNPNPTPPITLGDGTANR